MVDLNRLEAEVNDWTEAMGIKKFSRAGRVAAVQKCICACVRIGKYCLR